MRSFLNNFNMYSWKQTKIISRKYYYYFMKGNTYIISVPASIHPFFMFFPSFY